MCRNCSSSLNLKVQVGAYGMYKAFRRTDLHTTYPIAVPEM